MKNSIWNLGMLTVLTIGLFGTGAVQGGEPTNPATAVLKSHIMTTPDEITWGECPPAVPAGAKCAVIEGDMNAPDVLFAFRIKLPDNYSISPHFHPADEHVVVLSGTFNVGLGDKLDTNASKAMPAGSFMVMPKGTHHFAWSKGETVIQVYAIGPWGLTYVNPADDPRKQ
jgi:quercetin dioxygenase-like cupin family protein